MSSENELKKARETIRQLKKLAKAQDKLLAAYRVGSAPAENVLDTIRELKHLMSP